MEEFLSICWDNGAAYTLFLNRRTHGNHLLFINNPISKEIAKKNLGFKISSSEKYLTKRNICIQKTELLSDTIKTNKTAIL